MLPFCMSVRRTQVAAALLVAAIAVCANGALAQVYPGSDRVGLYFDTAAARNWCTMSPGASATAYVIMTGCSDPTGLGAWECKIVPPANVASLTCSPLEGWIIVGNCVEIQSAGATPIPNAPTMVLGSINFFCTSNATGTFRLTSTTNPSLPGSMAYCSGANSSILRPMYANHVPTAIINPARSIVVDPNPNTANAGWRIDGPNGYSYSSTGDRTLTNLDFGTYTVTWQPVANWAAPIPATIQRPLDQWSGGQTFSGTYAQLAQMTVDCGPDNVRGPWHLTGPAGYVVLAAGDTTVSNLEPGDYVFSWQAVAGWGLPEPGSIAHTVAGGEMWTVQGTYRALPAIIGFQDIGDDQGGVMRVSWSASPQDVNGATPRVTQYDVERFAGSWHWVTSVPARTHAVYSAIVEGVRVFVAGQAPPWQRYRIVARCDGGAPFWVSNVDSTYSFDNLAPAPPELVLHDTETSRIVVWNGDGEADALETCLYRGRISGFVSDAPHYCSSAVPYYIEDDLDLYYYRARTFDIHGNVSEWSNEVVGRWPTPVPIAPSTTLRLYPCQPNPFNPRTTIRYDVPESGSVHLGIFDLAGRLVRTLVDDSKTQGSYEVTWDGRDTASKDVGSGTYLARLRFGNRIETVRMGLIR